MSFAASLAQASSHARAGGMHNYVNAEVEKFKETCTKQAAAGFRSASQTTSAIPCVGDATIEEFIGAFRRHLDAMGFDTFSVNHLFKVLQLKASWGSLEPPQTQGGYQQQAQAQTRPTGTALDCPVCHESRPGAVLVPCGHTLCRQCIEQFRGRQCPCCRSHVQTVSDGLFIN
eukprot:TRINITY_DN105906_c0_g1_i1.p1 TRINITY_DN105906_c0_g1~~TRINITY_DN105906_c0_g1_i1.p1  ORF type:complete len:193 (+),score=38.51 TRINITY_DN105906_c0_g1_i1:61-579(+)